MSDRNHKTHIDELFKLRPIKAAKVSEISEATASSGVPKEDRVNFHIGNPVEDDRLTQMFLLNVLRLKSLENLSPQISLEEIIGETAWEKRDLPKLELVYNSIKKSIPYSPRGGYLRTQPVSLIKKLQKWLSEDQQDSLQYDLGEKSGKRECIIASGGKWEGLRILLHSINDYILNTPDIIPFGFNLPGHLTKYDKINFLSAIKNEEELLSFISNTTHWKSNKPIFLIIGNILTEELRRELRLLAAELPLFFIEVNDAPNHLSLAREAKMSNRVLRILSPKIFSERLSELSILFFAGNSDYIKVIETVHFQLKGTPSASEIELLDYLIDHEHSNYSANGNSREPKDKLETDEAYDFPFFNIPSSLETITNIANRKADLFETELVKKYPGKIFNGSLFKNHSKKFFGISDLLLGKSSEELVDNLLENLNYDSFFNQIEDSFLSSFALNHPEYVTDKLTTVSGSSRTALGLLGYYCGINEVITYDLSWTYEHCFPNVTVLALTKDFEIDIEAIKTKVTKKISEDKNWIKRGAVAINNPHNASGKIFNKEKLKSLIKWLLERGIYIIDDLAYQNVLPKDSLNGPQTVKQLALELVNEGSLFSEDYKTLITCHSVSKTDCFAGARLAVTEILDNELNTKFRTIAASIKPNILAILLSYLFYRNDNADVRNYWLLRNKIFARKMAALKQAVLELPEDRNQFDIDIVAPEGSMYPRMTINKLPDGLSLDWLSSGLATQGIGLVPLSAFSRTSSGYELARKSFRLTLGGTDTPEELLRKTRRVLIDLNRMIAEEKSKYNRREFAVKEPKYSQHPYLLPSQKSWQNFVQSVEIKAKKNLKLALPAFSRDVDPHKIGSRFINQYLPERLANYTKQFSEQLKLTNNLLHRVVLDRTWKIKSVLEREFYKDNLESRIHLFKMRSFDRTVHPTQMFSYKLDYMFNRVSSDLINHNEIDEEKISLFVDTLVQEYFGVNVSINSEQEGEELVGDLNSILLAEDFANEYSDQSLNIFLSFWGDWDGSSRPSGQGHRLVAAVLLENVTKLSNLVTLLLKSDKNVAIDRELVQDIKMLPQNNISFWKLLHNITALTNHLEKRYRSVLPYSISPGKFRKIGMSLKIAKDPLTRLWQHNDGLERKMLELRQQRKNRLEYYFALNKRLRKTLYNNIDVICKNTNNPEIAIQFGTYKDLLKRFVLTPRIHQKLITTRDQFSINTTVHNIYEINEISGNYGNPGMVMGLQVSMSNNPDALVMLDRKLNNERESVIKKLDESNVPRVWSIPLLEDIDTVKHVENYLDKIWEYAAHSRKVDQGVRGRFSEIICEVFIAGSDLSQQVGQTASWQLYKQAKYQIISWLAQKGLVDNVRIKLGSGEPMQRQGGYYADFSSKPAFINNEKSLTIFKKYLKESSIKSTEFARTPLHGIFYGGDLRTFQSTISEKLRFLSINDRAQLLHHVHELQRNHYNELVNAAEPFIDTRLKFESRSSQQLERLTLGKSDDIYNAFIELTRKNFNDIVYGSDDDVVGIHVISYFISRTIPTLRDRPAVRPSRNMGGDKGQRILERIASTIPLSKHGSLLRAIGHNLAQTVILGVNQLTTGLFRSLKEFSQKDFVQGDGYLLMGDRVLPNLAVYEILHTLRIYQDLELSLIFEMSDAFPAGNSAFAKLKEDTEAIDDFIPQLQKELLRRHGINVADFFNGNNFIIDLLPTVRPDLAVLLQPDLFNTDPNKVIEHLTYKIDEVWMNEFSSLLEIPNKVKYWRKKIWHLLKQPVYTQVKSFVELALALNTLSKDVGTSDFQLSTVKKTKFETTLSDLLRGKVDDSMRQFLSAAVQYLTRLPEDFVEVPIDIVRALKEVERILRIEEQALNKKEQELLNFYNLQIARRVGENG